MPTPDHTTAPPASASTARTRRRGVGTVMVVVAALAMLVTPAAAGSQRGEDDPPSPAELRSAALAQIENSALAQGRAAPATQVGEPYVPQQACHPFEKPGVVAFRDMVEAIFPRSERITKKYNVLGECDVDFVSEHREGRAWDFYVDDRLAKGRAVGDALTDWLTADNGYQAKRLGIMNMIWRQRIWNTRSQTWTPMADRGNRTTNHRDHVHFSFTWNGALQRSAYYTGTDEPPNYGWCARHETQFAPAGLADAQPDRSSPCPTPAARPATWDRFPVGPIAQGARGPRVVALREYLGDRDYTDDTSTWQFDIALYQAVVRFQRDLGVTATGAWDEETQLATGRPFIMPPNWDLVY